MEFPRERYVQKLVDRIDIGLIKIITGARRVGKSYLMNKLFYRHLIESGVDESKIIRFSFDSDDDIDLLDPYLPGEDTKIIQKGGGYLVNSRKFRAFIKERANGREGMFYLLDEVQLLEDFVGTLNGLLRNTDDNIYVTGSNSKFLSSDISTEFRGRVTIRFFTFHFQDASGRGEGAEGEVGGIVVVRIACVFQVFACADVLQAESLAFDIVDVPHGTVLHVLAVALAESEDETAPACFQRLRIQIAGLTPDIIGLVVGSNEPQQVAT